MRPIFALLLLIYAIVANADHAWWHFPPGPENHILAPGDIDRDGVVDLVRVTDTGTVHVTDVNGLNRYSFQTGFSEVQDVTAMPDVNTNGSRELAILGRTTTGPDMTWIGVWDPMVGAQLGIRNTLFHARHIERTRDQTGDGIGDLAVLEKVAGGPAHLNRTRVISYDGITMATLRTGTDTVETTFPVYPDPVQLLSGAKGIGILGENSPAGNADRLEFRNPETNTVTQQIWFGGVGKVHEARSLPDINGNKSREWAVLRTTGEGDGQRTSVVVRDGESKALVRTVDYIGWADPLKLAVVNGTQLAVVSRFADSGAQPLEVRDARTGALLRRVWFPATLHIQSVTRTPDINSNGSNEIAVIGEQWGKVVVMVTDSRTGKRLRRIVF